MTQDEAFKAWWYTEGSQAPYTQHDCEEHTMRMCEIAWANSAFKERETILKYANSNEFNRSKGENSPYAFELTKWIEERGQA